MNDPQQHIVVCNYERGCFLQQTLIYEQIDHFGLFVYIFHETKKNKKNCAISYRTFSHQSLEKQYLICMLHLQKMAESLSL